MAAILPGDCCDDFLARGHRFGFHPDDCLVAQRCYHLRDDSPLALHHQRLGQLRESNGRLLLRVPGSGTRTGTVGCNGLFQCTDALHPDSADIIVGYRSAVDTKVAAAGKIQKGYGEDAR